MSKRAPKLGATGRFPQGRLNKDDEDEITIAIGTNKGAVVVDFGKTVRWLGMSPEDAKSIADKLLQSAELAEQSGEAKKG